MEHVQSLNDQLNTRLILFLKEELGKAKVNKMELCREMGITTSILYKRLSGHSQFTIGEVAFLMKKYGLSFDKWVWGNGGYALFSNPAASHAVASIETYLLTLKTLFEALKPISKVQIHYAAREMPLFYYFSQPMLGAFKLFLFGKVVWNIPTYSGNAPFSKDLFSPYVLNSLTSLWDSYAAIPSIEIWNPNVLDNTLQQIIYLLEIRQFEDPEDSIVLLSLISTMVKDSSEMIVSGRKKHKIGTRASTLKVYNNQIMHTNNMIVAGNEEKKYLFLTHSNPNFLSSDDPGIIEHTLEWMNKLIQYSVAVDHDNSNSLDSLFRTLEQKIQFAKSKIEALLSRDKVMI